MNTKASDTTFFSKLSRQSFSTHFQALFRLGYKSPLKALFIVFLIIQITHEHHGADNVGSRLAHLASLAERGSSRIDPYVDRWTSDWARTPDGAHYSNKAPGPVFLALPFYYVFDKLTTIGLDGEISKRVRREKVGHPFFRIVSILLQTIPFLIIGFYFLGRLIRSGYSLRSQVWWVLAYLFGSTASVFLNTYFGHGIGLVFVLLMTIFMLEGVWIGVGFCFGWALLSDYAVGMLLPPLLIYLLLRKTPLKQWLSFILGGVVPGIIWILYHVLCFGGPLSLPNKFQNPRYVDVADSSTTLWGVIDLLPNLKTVGKLLWGFERGLLWTQPWVLLVIAALAGQGLLYFKKKSLASIWAIFIGLSFLGVFLMNASFGGWHGGSSPGPRYLVIVLPLLSFFVPTMLENWKTPSGVKVLLKGGILLALLVFGLIMSTTLMATPHEALYVSEGRYLWTPRSATAPLRFLFFLLSLAISYALIRRKLKGSSSHVEQ